MASGSPRRGREWSAPSRARGVEASLREDRGKSRRHEEGVALAQRDLQLLAQAQDQLTPGRGSARLHEAQVARGHLCPQRELELAEMPTLAPAAEMVTDAARAVLLHRMRPAQGPRARA